MYGPRGCLTEVEAKGLFAVHYGRDSLMWGCLPDWFFYWPTKFCKWVVLPQLIWLGNNVIIPLPMMVFLRGASYHLGLLIGAFQFVDGANQIIRFLLPLFEDDSVLEAPSLKEFREKSKQRKYGIFMDYKDFHPGYKPLFFIYRPIAWALFAVDRYRLLPIWTRLTRFRNDMEVKTLTKSPYHMGMKVTCEYDPGYFGSIEKDSVWLPSFVLDCT